MPQYMLQASYTPEAWARMMKSPQDRAEAIRPMIEGLGGTLHSFHVSFGEYDVVLMVEAPDNVSAAALSMAAAAGGSLSSIKTTPLMTVQEEMEALKKASGAGYRPPS